MTYRDLNKILWEVQAQQRRKTDAFTILRALIGIILFIVAIGAGVWAGVWWAFVGGIVQVINACQVHPVNAMSIAMGVARVFFCGLVGWVTFGVGLLLARISIGK
jgi:hypothetical protein